MKKSEAEKLIKDWFAKYEKNNSIVEISHIHIYTYVLGHAAPGCLITAKCHLESEPQCKDLDLKSPLDTHSIFDKKLKAGDWCISAYIVTKRYSQTVAIPYGV